VHNISVELFSMSRRASCDIKDKRQLSTQAASASFYIKVK